MHITQREDQRESKEKSTLGKARKGGRRGGSRRKSGKRDSRRGEGTEGREKRGEEFELAELLRGEEAAPTLRPLRGDLCGRLPSSPHPRSLYSPQACYPGLGEAMGEEVEGTRGKALSRMHSNDQGDGETGREERARGNERRQGSKYMRK